MANNLQRFKEYCDKNNEVMPEFKWSLGPGHNSHWIGTLVYRNTEYSWREKTKREVKERLCGHILILNRLIDKEEEGSELEGSEEEEDDREPGSSELRKEIQILRDLVVSMRAELSDVLKLIKR